MFHVYKAPTLPNPPTPVWELNDARATSPTATQAVRPPQPGAITGGLFVHSALTPYRLFSYKPLSRTSHRGRSVMVHPTAERKRPRATRPMLANISYRRAGASVLPLAARAASSLRVAKINMSAGKT